MSLPNIHAILSLVVVTTAVTVAPPAAADDERAEFAVVGYLPEYRFNVFDPARAGPLTDIIVFAIEPHEDGRLDTSRLDPYLGERLEALRTRLPVRWMLCVGGGRRSDGFPAMATDDAARKRFVDNLLAFCEKHAFEGVDIDWEHPRTPAEIEAHGRLLTELKQRGRDRRLAVTMAVAAWQSLSPQAIAAVDRVHLMSYNGRGPHATYERAVEDIRRLQERGVPREKICLGIPFYGRGIEDRTTTATYAEIVEKHAPAPDVNERAGLYFNGPAMVARKTQLSRRLRLKGVMIWEIGQDTPDPERSLLRTIGMTLADDAARSRQ